MSIIAHMLYDEAKAQAYRQEAESIIYDATGRTPQDAELVNCDRQYQRAVIAIVRRLTLYDLYHEPSTAPIVKNHPVRVAVPKERDELALVEVREILQTMGWTELCS